MKHVKFNECPKNFKGVEVTKWEEQINWMVDIIASYKGKRDEFDRIERLIDKFPQYAEIIEVDFSHETAGYAHALIKCCADYLAGNVRNDDWLNQYISELNYHHAEAFKNKMPKSVTPDED